MKTETLIRRAAEKMKAKLLKQGRGAQFSNGWHHNENCKNWVLKF